MLKKKKSTGSVENKQNKSEVMLPLEISYDLSTLKPIHIVNLRIKCPVIFAARDKEKILRQPL